MTRTNEHEAQAEAKTACSVVVVYDDTAARANQAVDFCDRTGAGDSGRGVNST